jgi:hypothetical protein
MPAPLARARQNHRISGMPKVLACRSARHRARRSEASTRSPEQPGIGHRACDATDTNFGISDDFSGARANFRTAREVTECAVSSPAVTYMQAIPAARLLDETPNSFARLNVKAIQMVHTWRIPSSEKIGAQRRLSGNLRRPSSCFPSRCWRWKLIPTDCQARKCSGRQVSW